jgi:hypothetical protein
MPFPGRATVSSIVVFTQILSMEPGLAWAKEVDLRQLNNEAAELEKVVHILCIACNSNLLLMHHYVHLSLA